MFLSHRQYERTFIAAAVFAMNRYPKRVWCAPAFRDVRNPTDPRLGLALRDLTRIRAADVSEAQEFLAFAVAIVGAGG
jgi:hypothetical protein